ncbi:MAG: DUF4258 domain-containing protein [Chloroflexota bacterium]
MSNLPKYSITNHAMTEATRRQIPLAILESVVLEPEQVVDGDADRKIHQSRVSINDKLYLIRVVVEQTQPITIVTVYRTSKIEKYWSDAT